MQPTRLTEDHWVTSTDRPNDVAIRASRFNFEPGQFLSHVSAAVLWDIPLPPGLRAGNLHVSVFSPISRPRSAGINGHELDERITTVTHVDGVCVSDPASTWCHLASMLDVASLVAAGDAIVTPNSAGQSLASVAELAEAVELRRGHKGAAQLRESLQLVRPGVASWAESVIRITLLRAGFHEPTVGYTLAGDARMPMAFEPERVAVDVCREVERPGRDRALLAQRNEALRRDGWSLVEFSDADVHPSHALELRTKLMQLKASLSALV